MDEYNLSALENEVSIMESTDHENIVKVHDIYNTPNHLHMIMDLCLVVNFLTELLNVV